MATRQSLIMHKTLGKLSLFFIVFVSVPFVGCGSTDTPNKAPSKTTHFDLRTVCPDGPTVECYSRHLRDMKSGKTEDIQSMVSALCKAKSSDAATVDYRQAMCFMEAKFFAAAGQDREAAKLRETACRLNSKFCIERQSRSYSPDFHEVFDLAPRFCAKGAVPAGMLTKLFLKRLCSLAAEDRDTRKLAEAWIEDQEKSFALVIPEIKQIQTSHGQKKVDFNFTDADDKTLSEFYLSLKTRELPIRVKFDLYHISAIARPMEYWAGELRKDAGKKPVQLPRLPLSGFAGTYKQGWTAGFSGYAAALPKDLFNLSRRLPIWQGSAFKRTVTATVIGYRETGVIPVPVIVLDAEVKM